MAARQAQFFIITAVLISGVIIAVSSVTPTYYISQQDQTLKIGLLTNSIDGVTESALGAVDIGNIKGKKYENKFRREISRTLSQLRYNDVSIVLNDIDLDGNTTGRINVRPMPGSPPTFVIMPASVNVLVNYTLSSPSFNINYVSSFKTNIRVAGTGASGGLVLVEDVIPDINRLTLPIFLTVNGEPYDNAAFEIGKKRPRDSNVTITDVQNLGNGIYILTIEYSTAGGTGGNTRRFNLEMYTAKAARTDLRILT